MDNFNSIEIELDNFTGPLDLLLQLLKKHKLEISDVSISEITEKYSEILKKMQERKLEVAGDYFVMASTLMLMKAKSLIPREKEAFEEMKEELLFKLEEYEKITRQAEVLSVFLDKRNRMWRRGFKEDFALKDKGVFVQENGGYVLGNLYSLLIKRLKAIEPEIVKRARYTMKQVVSHIYEVFKDKKKVRFYEIVKGRDKSFIVFSFSSVLELIKESVLKGVQTSTFSEIILIKSRNYSYKNRDKVISRYE